MEASDNVRRKSVGLYELHEQHLKSNYRKGIRRMEAILANPTHAAEFAANLGGVSVVLGVPISLPDRNSDKLLELLLGSDVADDAVLTRGCTSFTSLPVGTICSVIPPAARRWPTTR